MSEPAQKCENNAIFKQNNALEMFISLKMAISCCFGLSWNLDFPDFLQIKFYNINSWFELDNLKVIVMKKCFITFDVSSLKIDLQWHWLNKNPDQYLISVTNLIYALRSLIMTLEYSSRVVI